MKQIVMCMLLALAAGFSQCVAQTTGEGQELTRAERKALQAKLDSLFYTDAIRAIENKAFVLEADRVVFKRGMSAFVTSNTNFVAMEGDEAVVQVAFNIPFSGPNGIGGITVEGTVSNYEVKTDKQGNTFLSMNVSGVGISAYVSISLTKGTNRASVTVLPNFNSNRLTLEGRLLPIEKANVYQGRTL